MSAPTHETRLLITGLAARVDIKDLQVAAEGDMVGVVYLREDSTEWASGHLPAGHIRTLMQTFGVSEVKAER